MIDEKPLTKKDLLEALKALPTKKDVRHIVGEEISSRSLASKDDVRQIVGEEISSRGLASRDDVRQIVGEEIEARGLASKDDVRQIVKDEVFHQLTEFHANVIKPELDEMRERMDQMESGMNTRFDKLEVEVSHVKDMVKGLKAEFSTTPSRREFNELKRRVNRYHPAN